MYEYQELCRVVIYRSRETGQDRLHQLSVISPPGSTKSLLATHGELHR